MSNLRIIDSEKTISDLFSNLSKHEEIPISVHFGEEKKFAMLKFLDNEELPFFLCKHEDKMKIKTGEKVEITFFYKETFINFESEVRDVKDEMFFINHPINICTSFKRTKTRYKIHKEDNVFISVYGYENKYGVIDISTSGLSFEADKDLFDEGQSIRNIMVVLGGGQPVYVDAVVKYVSAIGESYFRYGVKFLSIEWMFYQKIFSFIFEKSYPDIKMMKEFSLDDVSSLYDKSRYIRLKNSGYGKDVMNSILKLEKLKNKPMISINLVQQREGSIDAIASALRVFNQAFYIQQILSLPEEDMESLQKTDMYSGVADCLLGHPYFDSLIMYINNDIEWFLEMIRIMQEIINDEEKISFEPFEVYECNTNTSFEKSSFNSVLIEDITDFLTFSNKTFSHLENQTYCYNNTNFLLSDLQDVYQSMGYFISRKIFEVKRGGELIAYAVAEAFSEDVDIDGFMNNVRLYTIEKDFDMGLVVESLLAEVSLFYKKFGLEKFLLISKQTIHCDKIEEKESVHRLIMSRDGVVEFLYFIKANII